MEPINNLDYQKAHIHDDRGSLMVGVSITLMILSVITVALRFLSRWIKRLPWEADDYTMIPALVGLRLSCCSIINRTMQGFTLLICIETLRSR